MVRAKFKLERYETTLSGTQEMRTLILHPVYGSDPDSENRQWWTYTPSGEIKLGTVNPAAWEQFTLGAEYYVDFTPALQTEAED